MVAVALTAVLPLAACGSPERPVETTGPVDRQAERDAADAYFARLGECLTDKGFPASVQADGALKVDHGGRSEQLAAAEAECAGEVGPQPTAVAPDATELGKFYDVQVNAYECLTNHGLDPVPPSSKEQFVATYLTGESWWAHQPQQPGGPPMPTTDCPLPQLTDIEW